MKTKIPYLKLTSTLGLAVIIVSLGAGCGPKSDTAPAPATNAFLNTSPATEQDLARQRAAMEQAKNNTPPAETVAPDNTRVNVRDRVDSALLPGDQGATELDRDITQQIRKGLTGDAAYSIVAQNVKVITAQGRVTLRGPVNTQAEKDGIVSLAKTIAGSDKVDDQLEVKTDVKPDEGKPEVKPADPYVKP